MLPVSLDCPFLIAPSVFSNVYLFCLPSSWVLCIQCCQYRGLSILDCPFGFLYRLFVLFTFVLGLVYPMLPVSLDCPSLIAPSVFSNVYLFCLPSSWVLCTQVLPVFLNCPFLIAPFELL